MNSFRHFTSADALRHWRCVFGVGRRARTLPHRRRHRTRSACSSAASTPGIEEVTVLESADGWTLRGSGKLRAPVNLAMDYLGGAVRPRVEADRAHGQPHRERESVDRAHHLQRHDRVERHQRRTGQTPAPHQHRRGRHDRAAEPDLRRLRSARRAAGDLRRSGAQLQAFIAPQDALPVTVHNVTDETIKVPGRTIAARRWTLHMGGGSREARDGRVDRRQPAAAPRHSDPDAQRACATTSRACRLGWSRWRGRTTSRCRFRQTASASPRRFPGPSPPLRPSRRGSGASRSGAPAGGRAGVGLGTDDRDEFVAGIPIFAQLATALADAGYLVVRYDERGTGQSGGRQESATIDEFAVDARAVVTYLLKRKDVDPRRISSSATAKADGLRSRRRARAENRGRRVDCHAVDSRHGAGARAAAAAVRARIDAPAAQQAAVEQQKKILEAVITGKGWENFNARHPRSASTRRCIAAF